MSLSLKFFFMVSFICFCQIVKCSRRSSICTRMEYDATAGFKKIRDCCNGYKKDIKSSKFLRCKPVCKSGCPNGRCVAPDFCHCNDGYTINVETFNCEPRCIKPCYNGHCVSPDTCKCRSGFSALNVTHCELILCTPSCFNGDCVGPNKCKCHDGYQLSGQVRDGFDYTCLPHSTTSTSTVETSPTSIADDEMIEDSEVTDQVKVDHDLLFTDEDVSHGAEDFETITEPEVKIKDSTSDINVTDGMTVIVSFKGVTELDNDSQKGEDTKNGTEIWIYISTAILLVAVAMLLVVPFRRKLLGYIKGRTYVVEDQQTRKSSVSSYNFNVAFSSTSNGK